MRKYFLAALIVILSTGISFAQSKETASSGTVTAVPKALLGHWQKGTFSLTSFEEPNGKYVGPANETSVSYVVDATGTVKEYFISNTNTYNCRMQILGYREGKLIMNADGNSFEFRPSSGHYSTLSCMSKTAAKKTYSSKDLYPDYSVQCTLETDEKGMPVLITKNKKSSEGLQLKKVI